jgi:hypothetical protein
MTNLVFASLFLPLSHFLISSTALRTMLVRRLGEGYPSVLPIVNFELWYSSMVRSVSYCEKS